MDKPWQDPSTLSVNRLADRASALPRGRGATRLSLNGDWRFAYLPDYTCPAELPPSISAFLSQQHRWNKGLIETALKLMPRIWQSNAPLPAKVEAWFHLTSPVMHVVILLLALLIVPSMFVTVPIAGLPSWVASWLGGVFLVLGAIAAGVFYVVSQRAQGINAARTIVRLPLLMALGVGISVVNSRAVLEALLNRRTAFVRTPKFGETSSGSLDPVIRSATRRLPDGALETTIGSAMIGCLAWPGFSPHTLIGLPFLALFAGGFLVVGVPSLVGEIRRYATLLAR